MLCRLATVLVVTGCGRLHFAEVSADAALDAPPLALACNTPVKLVEAPLGGQLTAVSMSSTIIAGWIEPGGQLDVGVADFVAPDRVLGTLGSDPGDTGYTAISSAASASLAVSAYTRNGVSYVEVLDANLATLGGPTATSIGVLGANAVAMTGNAADPIAAVTGNDAMTGRAEILPVNADGTLGTPVDSGTPNTRSALVNVGDRLAVIDNPPTNNCEIKTADLGVTTRTSTVGWGTNGQCSQPMLGYSPGRSDALLVRHDLTDSDVNHVIATRGGPNYTIPGESRLRTPANEARPVGVADGYWVSYETGGTLEAVHLDAAATLGTPVVLGPLADPTAHATVVKDGEAYAIWLQDGLELAHLCP